MARFTFRALILKSLFRYSLRVLSMQLARRPLYRKFCGMEMIGPVKSPEKSTLHRWGHLLPAEKLEGLVHEATRFAADGSNPLELTSVLRIRNDTLKPGSIGIER